MRATIAAAGNALAKSNPRQRIGDLKDMAGDYKEFKNPYGAGGI